MALGDRNTMWGDFTGAIWGRDNTIGRNPGMNLGISDTQNGTVLKIITQPTRGGSLLLKAQRQTACDCDKLYKGLSVSKIAALDPWFRAIRGKPYDRVAPYHIFMKICLKKLPEMLAFMLNSYCTYYRITNDEYEAWDNRCITLFGFPYLREDGTDVAVYRISGVSWKSGRIKYEPYMICDSYIPVIPSPGKASIFITGLQPGSSIIVALYSGQPEEG